MLVKSSVEEKAEDSTSVMDPQNEKEETLKTSTVLGIIIGFKPDERTNGDSRQFRISPQLDLFE
jgi:hypothetical protein